MIPEPTLAAIWLGIILLEVALYVLLDGGDLGLGVLSLLPHKEKERTLIMHTMGPIWDANETWIVIAAGTLFGAFPLAYGIILNALYIPVMVFILGIVLRAVSFEFHAFSKHKWIWSKLFGIGSLIAILGQGAAVGGLLGGIAIENNQFAGGPFDWATPLTLLVTVGILASYAVVGYAYLIRKTAHEFREQSFTRVLLAAGVTVVALLGATIFLPSQSYLFFTRWTTAPTSYVLFTIAALIGLLSLILGYMALKRQYDRWLHPLCMGICVLSMTGLLVGVFPYIIPPNLTIYEAAASPATLQFMLWGIGPLIPIVLAYNFYLHKVFEGDTHKTRGEEY